MKKITMFAGAAALAFASTASAEIEGEVTVGYNSQYNFRGINFGEDQFEAGVSLGTEYAGYNLGVGIWATNVQEAPIGETEVDYYASIGKDVTLGGIEGSVEVGYTKYTFPDEGSTTSETGEIYLALGTSYSGLDFGLAFYRDVEAINEWYAEATVGYSHALSSCLSLDLELGLAYSFDYYSDAAGNSDSELSHLWVGAALPWSFSDNATLSPYIKYVQAQDATEDRLNQDDELLGGVVLSVGF